VTKVKRIGSLVVLEHGAAWPSSVFWRAADRDGVLVVARQIDESLCTFLGRLAERIARVARHALSISTVMVVFAGPGGTPSRDRLLLLRGIAQQVARDDETRFVIVGDGSEGLALADTLLEHLHGERVTVHVVSRSTSAWCTRGASALPWSA
jgi:hypothetical protein